MSSIKLHLFALILKWVWRQYKIVIDIYAPNDKFEGLQITIGEFEDDYITRWFLTTYKQAVNPYLDYAKWNNRPAFDKAIDALMDIILSMPLDGTYKQWYQQCKLEMLISLTWDEALEIYHTRTEERKNEQ